MATTSLWKVGGNINNAITYVENKEKTEIAAPDKSRAITHLIQYTTSNRALP